MQRHGIGGVSFVTADNRLRDALVVLQRMHDLRLGDEVARPVALHAAAGIADLAGKVVVAAAGVDSLVKCGVGCGVSRRIRLFGGLPALA